MEYDLIVQFYKGYFMKQKLMKTIMSGLAVIFLLTAGGFTSAWSEQLTMGLIPAENKERMIQRFEPLRAYLEKKSGNAGKGVYG